jgi:hypothetical protein
MNSVLSAFVGCISGLGTTAAGSAAVGNSGPERAKGIATSP